jgi:hypothetical protein
MNIYLPEKSRYEIIEKKNLCLEPNQNGEIFQEVRLKLCRFPLTVTNT